MIRVKNLTFSYKKDSKFIENLNLNIKKGTITTIIGPNGSGKSTLLSILCGLNKPGSGQVLINNKKINEIKCKELAKEIATVHQQNTIPGDITIEELVAYGRIPHKNYFDPLNEEDRKVIDWAMKSMELYEFRNKSVMNLSGGERQRGFIAMALAQKSPILFLDEPTTYLDIHHQVEILEMIKYLNEINGITVVMVLHDINQAIKYSDNIVVMQNGEIVANGKTKEVINIDLLKKVYQVDGYLNKCEETKEIYFIPKKIS